MTQKKNAVQDKAVPARAASKRAKTGIKKSTTPPFQDKAVKQIFDQFPEKSRQKFLKIRQLIFDVAAATDGVGELTETLRWGEPSYLTQRTKSGSMIRLNIPRQLRESENPEKLGVYFQCQTTLVGDFRRHHADRLQFEGNRAILIDAKAALPVRPLKDCFRTALTYHLNKRQS